MQIYSICKTRPVAESYFYVDEAADRKAIMDGIDGE